MRVSVIFCMALSWIGGRHLSGLGGIWSIPAAVVSVYDEAFFVFVVVVYLFNIWRIFSGVFMGRWRKQAHGKY